MAKKKEEQSGASEDENKNEDEESTDSDDEEESEDEEEIDSEDEDESDEEEGDDKKGTEKKEEIDYDKELEEEEARGKPDKNKARKAFKDREDKRDDEDEGEDEKPLTRKDRADLIREARQDLMAEQAFTIARSIANSDPEAKLIVAKWSNRSFPEGVSLQDQIEEAYAITHRKRLIGERSEALRALKNKANVKRDAAGTHRDGKTSAEPKLSAGDAAVYKQSGFVWDGTKRLYKKPLKKGTQFLYKDPKSKRQWVAA